jgi:predicted permease
MSLWRHLSHGFRSLLNRSAADKDIADEVEDYMNRAVAAHVARGCSLEEAKRSAQTEAGSAMHLHEEVRSYGWENRIETLLSDLRYALRSLRSAPGFTAVVILTLGFGIGANTAIFSLVDATLTRSLPYPEPDRLWTLTQTRTNEDARFWNASYPDFLDWRSQSKSFQSLAGFTGDAATLRGEGDPVPLAGVAVTPNFFTTLGIKPAMGRDFAAGEDVPTGPNVVLLTHSFWQTRFGAAPDIVGRKLQFDTHSVTVIGVLPKGFEFAPAGAVQYWAPLHMSADNASRRSLRWISVLGRLAPGVTEQQVRSEMDLINQRLSTAYPQQNSAIHVIVSSLRDRVVGQVQPVLLILFGAVAIVLVIACANVANLLIARASRRRREFAIRAALGAGWQRLMSQNLTESGLLAVAGSLLGFILAQWGTKLLILPIPTAQLNTLPFLLDAHTDPEVLAFVCATAVLVALACGVAGALESFHHAGNGAVNEESRGSAGASRTRLRNMLVVSEVAFSLVLLVSAGLMGRSLSTLLNHNAGFDRSNLLTFSVALPNSYADETARARFNQEFTNNLRAIPGVKDVAVNSVPPLSGGGNTVRFVVEGQTVDAGHEGESNIRQVSTNYFSMMGIPLLSGRFFDDGIDTPEAPRRLIVTKAWVQRYMRGENPIGRRIRFTFSPTQPFREIIGVVGDIADADLDSSAEPGVYAPTRQQALGFVPYLVRTAVLPSTVIRQIHTALAAVDSSLTLVADPQTMDEITAQSPSVFLRRYPSYLIGSFAALALFLAVLGLYGLISYSVAQRQKEIGVRMALGARPQNVVRLVMSEGAGLVAIGVTLGLVASFVLTRLLTSLLFGVNAADPETFIGVVLLLGVVAAIACAIPARRATRTDPIVALREM